MLRDLHPVSLLKPKTDQNVKRPASPVDRRIDASIILNPLWQVWSLDVAEWPKGGEVEVSTPTPKTNEAPPVQPPPPPLVSPRKVSHHQCNNLSPLSPLPYLNKEF